MSKTETFLQTLLVWAFVYPCVLVFGYGADLVAPDAPKWAVTLISTLFTVSLIQFAGVPLVERVIARRRGDTRAKLLAAKARDATGPADHESANG
ncbi:MAG: hypothetical protein ACU0BF_12210 [Paracoccaceae bacterium]